MSYLSRYGKELAFEWRLLIPLVRDVIGPSVMLMCEVEPFYWRNGVSFTGEPNVCCYIVMNGWSRVFGLFSPRYMSLFVIGL